jgi:hypothetical protein
VLIPAGAEVIRTLVALLHDILDRPPSASLLLDKYMKLVLVIDEVINEVRDGSSGLALQCITSYSDHCFTRAGHCGQHRQGSHSQGIEGQGSLGVGF